jgi:hypothetical protein
MNEDFLGENFKGTMDNNEDLFEDPNFEDN